MSLAKRHPLITFFVSTYVLTWAIESPLVLLGDSVTGTQNLVLVILASNVPSAVAIVLTAMVLGRGALRRLPKAQEAGGGGCGVWGRYASWGR
jgi:hypothetical protein